MTEKPDAGAVVGRQRVPILPDDTAREVFDKVTLAAELVLDAALPALLAGRAPGVAQDLAAGSYFGGRRAEDGRIDWSRSAREIHDLVRGVAPPYPGAFASARGVPLRILRTLVEPARAGASAVPALYCEGAALLRRLRLRRPAAAAALRAGRPRSRRRRAAGALWFRTRNLSTDKQRSHEKTPRPRRQRLHRPPPLEARARDHRLGRVRHGHADRARRGPARPTRAFTSSRATSRSTRSGSSTTSASATR